MMENKIVYSAFYEKILLLINLKLADTVYLFMFYCLLVFGDVSCSFLTGAGISVAPNTCMRVSPLEPWVNK